MCAFVQLALIAVLDGEVDLDVDLRVKYFLTQRTAVEVVGVDVHQVLLELVWLPEQLLTTGTPILGCHTEKMGCGMSF